MDASDTYETAREALALVGRLELTDEQWAAFAAAAAALTVAAAADDLAGIERETGRIALLSHDRARSRSNPALVQQPRRAREAAAQATKALQAGGKT